MYYDFLSQTEQSVMSLKKSGTMYRSWKSLEKQFLLFPVPQHLGWRDVLWEYGFRCCSLCNYYFGTWFGIYFTLLFCWPFAVPNFKLSCLDGLHFSVCFFCLFVCLFLYVIVFLLETQSHIDANNRKSNSIWLAESFLSDINRQKSLLYYFTVVLVNQ